MIIVDETLPIGELPLPFVVKNVEVKLNEDIRDSYELKKEIGRGRFGTVYLCNCKKTGTNFAAKFVNTKRNQDRENVEREIEIMKCLNPHPKLIQLYDAYDMGKEMCLILEVVQGGELFERVIDDDFILTERACAIFIRQIVEGVEFIHSKNVLHLDMKPENILCISRQGNRVKICDFGLARKYDPRKKLQVLFGTPEFVAPEVVNFEPIGFGTDMWSIGVICYVLLSGLSPFMGHNYVETMTNVTHNKYDFDEDVFDDVSDDVKDFIEHLLLLDKNERLTPAQCLRHPWFKTALMIEPTSKKTSAVAVAANEMLLLETSENSSDVSTTSSSSNESPSKSEEEVVIGGKLDLKLNDATLGATGNAIVNEVIVNVISEKNIPTISLSTGNDHKSLTNAAIQKDITEIETTSSAFDIKEMPIENIQKTSEQEIKNKNGKESEYKTLLNKSATSEKKAVLINIQVKEEDKSETIADKNIAAEPETGAVCPERNVKAVDTLKSDQPAVQIDSERRKEIPHSGVNEVDANSSGKDKVDEKSHEEVMNDKTDDDKEDRHEEANSVPVSRLKSLKSIDEAKSLYDSIFNASLLPEVVQKENATKDTNPDKRKPIPSGSLKPSDNINITKIIEKISNKRITVDIPVLKKSSSASISIDTDRSIVEELSATIYSPENIACTKSLYESLFCSATDTASDAIIQTSTKSIASSGNLTTQQNLETNSKSDTDVERSQSTPVSMRNEGSGSRERKRKERDFTEELELTKRHLKEFVERWNSHPNSPYVIIGGGPPKLLPTLSRMATEMAQSRSSFASIEVVPPSEIDLSDVEDDILPMEEFSCYKIMNNSKPEPLPPEKIARELEQRLSMLQKEESLSKSDEEATNARLFPKEPLKRPEVVALKRNASLKNQQKKPADTIKKDKDVLKRSDNVKLRPSRDVIIVSDKKDKKSRSTTPDFGLSPVSTPNKRSRRSSREEYPPSRDSDRGSTPIKTRRRPSRDVPLSTSQLEILGNLTSLHTDRCTTIELWPDMICLANDDSDSTESDYQPITAKLQLPMTASCIQETLDNSKHLKKAKSLDNKDSKTVTWILDIETPSQLPFANAVVKGLPYDDISKTALKSDGLIPRNRSKSPSPSLVPSNFTASCRSRHPSTSSVNSNASVDSLTIQTPWGPMRRSPSRASLKSAENATIINIKECFINITKTPNNKKIIEAGICPSFDKNVDRDSCKEKIDNFSERSQKVDSDNILCETQVEKMLSESQPQNKSGSTLPELNSYSLSSSKAFGKYSAILPNNITHPSSLKPADGFLVDNKNNLVENKQVEFPSKKRNTEILKTLNQNEILVEVSKSKPSDVGIKNILQSSSKKEEEKKPESSKDSDISIRVRRKDDKASEENKPIKDGENFKPSVRSRKGVSNSALKSREPISEPRIKPKENHQREPNEIIPKSEEINTVPQTRIRKERNELTVASAGKDISNKSNEICDESVIQSETPIRTRKRNVASNVTCNVSETSTPIQNTENNDSFQNMDRNIQAIQQKEQSKEPSIRSRDATKTIRSRVANNEPSNFSQLKKPNNEPEATSKVVNQPPRYRELHIESNNTQTSKGIVSSRESSDIVENHLVRQRLVKNDSNRAIESNNEATVISQKNLTDIPKICRRREINIEPSEPLEKLNDERPHRVREINNNSNYKSKELNKSQPSVVNNETSNGMNMLAPIRSKDIKKESDIQPRDEPNKRETEQKVEAKNAPHARQREAQNERSIRVRNTNTEFNKFPKEPTIGPGIGEVGRSLNDSSNTQPVSKEILKATNNNNNKDKSDLVTSQNRQRKENEKTEIRIAITRLPADTSKTTKSGIPENRPINSKPDDKLNDTINRVDKRPSHLVAEKPPSSASNCPGILLNNFQRPKSFHEISIPIIKETGSIFKGNSMEKIIPILRTNSTGTYARTRKNTTEEKIGEKMTESPLRIEKKLHGLEESCVSSEISKNNSESSKQENYNPKLTISKSRSPSPTPTGRSGNSLQNVPEGAQIRSWLKPSISLTCLTTQKHDRLDENKESNELAHQSLGLPSDAPDRDKLSPLRSTSKWHSSNDLDESCSTNSLRRSKIGLPSGRKRSLGLFTAQDRISLFEQKTEDKNEKVVLKPIRRSKSSTVFSDPSPSGIDIDNTFNSSPHCDRSKLSPSVVCSKLTNVEFMRNRLLQKVYSINTLSSIYSCASNINVHNSSCILERAQTRV